MPDVAGFTHVIDPEDAARGLSLTVTFSDGTAVVSVPAHAQFTHPVRISWAPQAQTSMKLTIGKGARVTVVEEFGGMNNEKLKIKNELWSHSVEIHLEDNAVLEFISINRLGSDVALTMKQQSTLADNATIRWRNVTLGGASVEQDLVSELAGKDAVSAVDWMFYAKDEEKYRLTARNIFNGRHGGGEITMKGVAEGKGHVRCFGMIEIGLHGGQTDTYLTQDVLMLDKTSKVDAIPGLEIKTNDVKASHSATVSRVTEEDLFYFAARGIMEKEAKRMFVEGFLGDLVAKMGDSQTCETVVGAIEAKYQR